MRIISVLLLAATTCGALTVDIPPLDTERPADGEALMDVDVRFLPDLTIIILR